MGDDEWDAEFAMAMDQEDGGEQPEWLDDTYLEEPPEDYDPFADDEPAATDVFLGATRTTKMAATPFLTASSASAG